MQISSGDMTVQQFTGVVTMRRSQLLQTAGAGVREREVFLEFEIFFPAQVNSKVDINQETSLHSLNSNKGFKTN